jgi:two-component system sensor histidine kinase CpxA
MADSVERLLAGHKQLLGDISHEFRTPLARLRVALELARREAGSGAAAYLDTMEKQTEAIDGMIEELLTYSRLDSTPYQLRAEPLQVAALIEQAAAEHQPELEAGGITIDTAGPQAEGGVTGDRRLIERALSNVLRNAIAHAPRGSAVRLQGLRGGGRVTFAVSDAGPGVAADMLDRIFEPFVKTSVARSRASGGVGLGLAIARRCMQAHGGGAYAEPAREGTGLTVTLWLPLEAE